jgi:hypothetical protein
MSELQESRFTLTRTEVAARLGVSVATVRRLEYEQLFPSQDARGVHRFDPAEVDAVTVPTRSRRAHASTADSDVQRRATQKRGRTAARIFRLFRRGTNLAQIVVATNVPPDVVRELYREWCTSLEQGEWERRAGVVNVPNGAGPSRS